MTCNDYLQLSPVVLLLLAQEPPPLGEVHRPQFVGNK